MSSKLNSLKDLIGLKIHKLTVIEFAYKKYYTIYLKCKCECGKEYFVNKNRFIKGLIKSCGCIGRGKAHNRLDLVGKIFGYLEVLKFAFVKNKNTFWECKCECGNYKNIQGTSLATGVTKSCGCIQLSFEDLVNKIFGRLKVVEFCYRKRRGEHFWRCECSCGNQNFIVNGSSLKAGNTTSCGCLSKELGKLRTKEKSYGWKGIGDLPGRYINSIKHGAKTRNLIFEVDKEYLWKLFLKQNKKCALSGIELCFESKTLKSDGTASLDRIDNTKGYIDGNLQWIHKDINFMKQDFDQEKFLKYCSLIAQNIKLIA